MKPTTVILFMAITVASVQSQGFFGDLANFLQGLGGRGNRGNGGGRRPAAQQSGGGRGRSCSNRNTSASNCVTICTVGDYTRKPGIEYLKPSS